MSARLELGSGDVHIWLSRYREAADDTLRARYHGLLDAAENTQQRRFHFADDRLRYLVTRALVRCSLSRYASIEPGEWVFERDPHGKPRIANGAGGVRDLAFNVSHTRELIALAVTRKRAIGVDAENLVARAAPLEIAARFFSPRESAALQAEPAGDRNLRFFEYWTFKEAYIKARGLGMSLPLEKFTFLYPRSGAVEFSTDPELEDSPARWQFWQFRPTPAHIVAVCAEKRSAAPFTLVVRETVPLRTETVTTPELARVSRLS